MRARRVSHPGRRAFLAALGLVAAAGRAPRAQGWLGRDRERFAVRESLDLPYDTGPGADPERHRLNLLVPDVDRPVPAMMWIPGGFWAAGSRAQETPLGRRFAASGLAVAAIDHRMSSAAWVGIDRPDGARHPDHITDCARAFAWLAANGAGYGIDTARLAVGGFSTGAHLAALLALDTRWLAAEGVDPALVGAVVLVAGAYDLPRYRDWLLTGMDRADVDSHLGESIGLDPAVLAEASPNRYLDGATVPMLVVSDAGTGVYADWLAEDVRAHGLEAMVQFRAFPALSHTALFQALSDVPDHDARLAISAFVRSVLR